MGKTFEETECAECGKNFNTVETLHKHLRGFHKTTQYTYYHKHFPRYDKLDKSLIRFKNLEQYRSTDFNSRANMATWFKNANPNEAESYLSYYFTTRKFRKGLIYAPCQVELRTLPIVGIKYIQSIVGSYEVWTAKLGFKKKFDLVGLSETVAFTGTDAVLVDTREQKPLSFKVPSELVTLNFADYAFKDMDKSRHGFIERKGLGDLYQTMTKGAERFQNELNRAKSSGAYIVIIVEGSFQDATNYPDTTGGHVRIHPEYVFHSVREFIKNNDHIQFLFVNNRQDASRVIERIFTCNGQYKTIDLQYAYDTGQLIGQIGGTR